MQDRLTEIEIKLAHVEQALTELSDVLYQQQGYITQLEANYENLRQRVQSGGEGSANTGPEDDKPPHY
jgi:uncharacterized coiled-coil protein SlyX